MGTGGHGGHVVPPPPKNTGDLRICPTQKLQKRKIFDFEIYNSRAFILKALRCPAASERLPEAGGSGRRRAEALLNEVKRSDGNVAINKVVSTVLLSVFIRI